MAQFPTPRVLKLMTIPDLMIIVLDYAFGWVSFLSFFFPFFFSFFLFRGGAGASFLVMVRLLQ